MWLVKYSDSGIPVIVAAQMFDRNIVAEAFGTHGEIVDGNVAVDSHSFTRFNLHQILGSYVWQNNVDAAPFIANAFRRPPESCCNVFFLFQLNNWYVEASYVHSVLVDEEPGDAGIFEGRTGVGVTGWRWIEDHWVDNCIAGETHEAAFLRVGSVLVHVDKHVISGLVGVQIGVIELRPGFLCRCGTDVSRPLKQGLAGVLPPTPAVLEIALTAKRDFVWKPQIEQLSKVNF